MDSSKFDCEYYSLPKHVSKGWGYESWIVNKPEYCGKLLFFKKGRMCSWHFHNKKDETFHVHEGKLLVKYGFSDDLIEAKEIILEPGDSFYVPVGMRHQMKGLLDTWMYEFSTEHFEEDSCRIIKGD